MTDFHQFQRLTVAALLLVASPLSAQNAGWPQGGTGNAEFVRASPLLVDLNNDSRLEIFLANFDDKLYGYNHDGTPFEPLSGSWPVTLGFNDGTFSSPAAGDVDGDGQPEIIIVGDDSLYRYASIRVYEIDGSLRVSQPLENNSNTAAKATPCLIDCYRYEGTSRHDALEIVIADGDGQLHILAWNGSGFDDLYENNATYNMITDNSLKDRFGSAPINSSAGAFVSGIDETTIIVGGADQQIHRWVVSSVSSSDTTENWAIQKESISFPSADPGRFYSSVLLTDLDGDGFHDYVIGSTSGQVFAFDRAGNGTQISGWPNSLAFQGTFSSPGSSDLDGDQLIDVFIGGDDGGLYVWNSAGAIPFDWPQAATGDIFASPVSAEADGQPGLEIAAASLDGHLYLWHSDGRLVDGWPKRLNTPVYGSPSFGDVHGSGRMSVVVGGSDGRLFVFDLPRKSLDITAGWQQFRGGPQRQGVSQ